MCIFYSHLIFYCLCVIVDSMNVSPLLCMSCVSRTHVSIFGLFPVCVSLAFSCPALVGVIKDCVLSLILVSVFLVPPCCVHRDSELEAYDTKTSSLSAQAYFAIKALSDSDSDSDSIVQPGRDSCMDENF